MIEEKIIITSLVNPKAVRFFLKRDGSLSGFVVINQLPNGHSELYVNYEKGQIECEPIIIPLEFACIDAIIFSYDDNLKIVILRNDAMQIADVEALLLYPSLDYVPNYYTPLCPVVPIKILFAKDNSIFILSNRGEIIKYPYHGFGAGVSLASSICDIDLKSNFCVLSEENFVYLSRSQREIKQTVIDQDSSHVSREMELAQLSKFGVTARPPFFILQDYIVFRLFRFGKTTYRVYKISDGRVILEFVLPGALKFCKISRDLQCLFVISDCGASKIISLLNKDFVQEWQSGHSLKVSAPTTMISANKDICAIEWSNYFDQLVICYSNGTIQLVSGLLAHYRLEQVVGGHAQIASETGAELVAKKEELYAFILGLIKLLQGVKALAAYMTNLQGWRIELQQPSVTRRRVYEIERNANEILQKLNQHNKS